MKNENIELQDSELEKVNGGNQEGYSLASRDIINIFCNAFLNNDGVMTKELASNCKQQVLGALYAYKNLGYLDERECKELSDILEEEYQLWLGRCAK